MNKPRRLAAIIGVVCGAELVAAVAIGGAGLAALRSLEAALVATLLGGAALWVIIDRRRSNAISSQPTPPPTDHDKSNSEADQNARIGPPTGSTDRLRG